MECTLLNLPMRRKTIVADAMDFMLLLVLRRVGIVRCFIVYSFFFVVVVDVVA